MFATYRSKGGFMVIGKKPMFEDVEDEVLGAAIKAKFLEVFGHYPILDISEKWEYMDEDFDKPVVLRDFHILLDTELLDKINGWELNYVDGLLERVLRRRMQDPGAKDVDTHASKKYCFSDTEDWWDAAKVGEVPDGRERFEVIVEIG
jgi:hypothetical protein